MGILDKVMFWKKSDDLPDFGKADLEAAGSDPFAPGNDPFASTGPDNLQGAAALTQGFDSNPSPDLGAGLSNQNDPFNPMGMKNQTPGQNPFQQSPDAPRFTQSQPPQQQSFVQNPQQDIENKNLEIISSKLDAIRASVDSLNQRLANLEAMARGEQEESKHRYY